MTRTAGQSGAAMLTVLTVLAGLGIVVSILLQRTRGNIRPWAKEAETTQALYSAESGIAYQLYLERFSDSAEPTFGKASVPRRDADPFAPSTTPSDTFTYRLDSGQQVPEVRVDRTRAFLDMTSKGSLP